MRTAIRQQLINQVAEFGGRVYQPNTAGPACTKPYAVVKLGQEKGANIRDAFFKEVQVWVYVDPADATALDPLVTKVINALHDMTLTTATQTKLEVRYTGFIGEEYYDTEWQALTQGLAFTTDILYARG